MDSDFDKRKSLQELEQVNWSVSTYDSYLAKTCDDLRNKPLIDFTIEDLRLMIGQGIGLQYLVPLALERLEENPLAEGDFYPGDLLAAVFQVDEIFWERNGSHSERIQRIVARIRETASFLNEPDRESILEVLKHCRRG